MPLAVSTNKKIIRVTGTTDTTQAIIDPTVADVFINSIYWFNPTSAGDLLTLKTSDGEHIIEFACESDGVSRSLNLGIYVKDIYCDDMDSGTLYIYTK
jgi:hypothetical protein